MARVAILRNRDRAQHLRSEIAKVKSQIDEDAAAAAQSRSLASSREQLLDDLAVRERAGELSRAQVDAHLEEADRDARTFERNAAARDRAMALRAKDLAALEVQLAAAEFEERVAAADLLVKKVDDAGGDVRRTLRAAAAAAAAYAEHAAAAKEAVAELRKVRDLIPDADDAPWVRDVKALDLPVTRELIAGNDSVLSHVGFGEPPAVIGWPGGHSAGLHVRVRFKPELQGLARLLVEG